MKRPRALIAASLLAALGLYLYAPLPGPKIAPASAGDCVLIHMWSNGYHSDIGVPADALPADHPLRRLFPNAHSILIGWGEKDFYFSDGTNMWLGLNAIIPPSPSVLHVVDNAEQGSRYLGPNEDASFAISHEGMASLSDYVRRELVLDPNGAVEESSPGKVIGHSFFLRARSNFHLFNVCNHWMARALRAAGLNINARNKWLAAPLIKAARRAAPASCPAQ